MNEDESHNGALDGRYQLHSSVNTRTARYIYDEVVDYDALCEHRYKNSNKYNIYRNKSDELYPYSMIPTMDNRLTIMTSVLAILIIAGFLGNINVLFTVALKRSVRTTINFYIANLALADAMTTIVGILAAYRMSHGTYYALGEFPCKFESFAFFTCITSSVLTLAAISCDRFMAVIFPLRARFTKKRRLMVVMIVWIISIALAVPHLIVSKLHVTEWKNFLDMECFQHWPVQNFYHKSLKRCIRHSPLFVVQSVVMTVTLYFLPLPIMLIAYSFILWRLRKSQFLEEGEVASDNIRNRARKKMNIMVFVVLLVFILCWTPLQLWFLQPIILPYYAHDEIRGFRMEWFQWYTALTNSFLNPIIYAGFNSDFRQGIREILCCKKRGVKPNAPRNTPGRLTVANNPEIHEFHTEMDLKHTIAEEDTSSAVKETFVSIEDTEEK